MITGGSELDELPLEDFRDGPGLARLQGARVLQDVQSHVPHQFSTGLSKTTGEGATGLWSFSPAVEGWMMVERLEEKKTSGSSGERLKT